MKDYFLLFISTVLVNNLALIKFLNLCPFIGVSKRIETAIGMGLATIFVVTITSVCSWFMDVFVLIPLNLIYLRTLGFILIIAFIVQFTEIIIHKISTRLYHLLGIFLPLITTNCAVLGISLLNVNQSHSFLQSAIYGFAASTGFSLVIILFSAIQERIIITNIPTPFRGSPISLITASLMSLAFMGFNGLVKF